ncbi:1761_t:CDS:2, partial [Gigaspora rosea]
DTEIHQQRNKKATTISEPNEEERPQTLKTTRNTKDHMKDTRPNARLNTNHMHNHVKDPANHAKPSRTLRKGAKEIQEPKPGKI